MTEHVYLTVTRAQLDGLRVEAERKASELEGLAREIRGMAGGASHEAQRTAERVSSEAEAWRALQRARSEDEPLDLAGSLLSAWYHGRVRDIAADVLDGILRGDVADDEALQERLDSEADGTDIVIYTYKAKAALLASENEDAYADEMGEPAPSPEVAAYFALRADVRESLDGMASYPPDGVTLPEGFELSDPETWRPVVDAEGGAS